MNNVDGVEVNLCKKCKDLVSRRYNWIKDSEIKTDKEGLKKDTLFRETLRRGFNYDTGDPFRHFAHYMVNSSGYRNIVLTTSDGKVLEADRREVREMRKSGRVNVLERFDSTESNYLISAPYFTKVARVLSNELQRAIERGHSINIKVNVESPFKEGKV